MDEIEIIEKIKDGDRQAFEVIFAMYYEKALRTAYLISGSQMVAEDIVQEAFVMCYTAISSLKNPAYFKTWFYRLLTRIAWRYAQKERKLVPVAEMAPLVEQGRHIQEVVDERVDLLYEAISGLENKLQTTLVLYYYNDLSIKEIARVMGCLEGTVKSRLFTSRKKIKGYVEKRERKNVIGEVCHEQ